MPYIPFSRTDLPSSWERYERFYDADSAIASVLENENVDISIDYCFDLIEHSVHPSKLLHENKKMKKLQKRCIKSIRDFNGGKTKYDMSHLFQCKERWFNTVKGKIDRYAVVSKPLAA